jgi:DNA-binding Xre family transcriptional regulator
MSRFEQALKEQMHHVGIPSFRELAKQAQVSLWQVQQLRQNRVAEMRFGILLSLSQALGLTLNELLSFCENPPLSEMKPGLETPSELEILKQEYGHLQTQLQQQRQSLMQEFQRSSLDILEPWLRNWPKVVYTVNHIKTDLLAANILPLLAPLEELLAAWGVEEIGAINDRVPYDPRWHQLVEGHVQPGDLVQVNRSGYRQGEVLLHRAEVKADQ